MKEKLMIYMPWCAAGAWVFAALVTFFHIQKIFIQECYFLERWPLCNQEFVWTDYLLQGMLLFAAIFLVGAGFLSVWKMFRKESRIFTSAALVSVISGFFVLPFASADINYYFNVGRAVSEGINPYTEPWNIVSEYTSDTKVSISSGVMYGPITVSVFHNLYALSEGKIGFFVLYIKFFVLIGFVGCGIILFLISRAKNYSISKQAFYALFFTQPLLIWEWIAQGHFDVWWIIPVLGSVWAAEKKKWWAVVVLLSISIWIKFIPVLMVPWFMLWFWQDFEKKIFVKYGIQIFIGLVISGMVSVVVWAPYWTGFNVFDPLLLQSKWAVNSIFSGLYYLIKSFFGNVGYDSLHWYLTRILQSLLLLTSFYFVYPYLKKITQIIIGKKKWDSIEYVSAMVVTMLVYILVWQKSLWPWYVTWLLPCMLYIILICNNKNLENIYVYLSIAPLFFYVPWMLMGGDNHTQWFNFMVIGVMCLYPLWGIYQWRKKLYA